MTTGGALGPLPQAGKSLVTGPWARHRQWHRVPRVTVSQGPLLRKPQSSSSHRALCSCQEIHVSFREMVSTCSPPTLALQHVVHL